MFTKVGNFFKNDSPIDTNKNGDAPLKTERAGHSKPPLYDKKSAHNDLERRGTIDIEMSSKQ